MFLGVLLFKVFVRAVEDVLVVLVLKLLLVEVVGVSQVVGQDGEWDHPDNSENECVVRIVALEE